MRTDKLKISRVTAERIRKLRRTKDYSQQFMADMLGISQNAYSKLESGKTPINLDRLCEVSQLLEIDAGDLLHDAIVLASGRVPAGR